MSTPRPATWHSTISFFVGLTQDLQLVPVGDAAGGRGDQQSASKRAQVEPMKALVVYLAGFLLAAVKAHRSSELSSMRRAERRGWIGIEHERETETPDPARVDGLAQRFLDESLLAGAGGGGGRGEKVVWMCGRLREGRGRRGGGGGRGGRGAVAGAGDLTAV